MKQQILNQKRIVSMLTMLLLIYGVQGISYGEQEPDLTVSPLIVPIPSNLSIYWTDQGTDKIQRADGSNVQDLVTQGLQEPDGITLDVAGGKMYWTDFGTNKIQRANLDGSNIEDLVTQGLEDPGHIALDVAGGKMYWTDFGTDKIQRANLDGSNIEDLVTQELGDPGHIALDVAGGKMYWPDYGMDKIQRANLDGSNIEDLVTQGLDISIGIALDVAGGKMYWTDLGMDKIQRANLDGSNVEDLVTQGLSISIGIALDVAGGKMYWTDGGTHKIQRANLDGSNVEDLVTQGLEFPIGIAIGISAPALPPPVREDVNRDGSVNIQDLVQVAAQLGQTGENDADINGDGLVNIQDLVLVAAAFGDTAGNAPALHAQALTVFSATEVHNWLAQAQQMDLTHPRLHRGVAVLKQLLAALPLKDTVLLPNYPNPFNPETWIPYQLAKPAEVSVSIYSADGRLVRKLDLGHQSSGIYQSRSRAAYWDGRNAAGEPVASGVYFYTLTAGEFAATRKMLIRK